MCLSRGWRLSAQPRRSGSGGPRSAFHPRTASSPRACLSGTEAPDRFGDRQIQCHRLAREAMKSEIFIKSASDFILGVNNECEDRWLGPHSTSYCVDDELTAKSAAAKSLVHGEPTDEACREGRITRQPPGLFGREFCKRETGRGECVVAGNCAGGIKCYEAVAYASSNILRRQLSKIPVERRHTARKSGAVVVGAERLKSERLRHRDGVTSRRYRSMARSIAGANGGGLRMVSAKARWSSTERRMIWVSSIVRCAASWAAATTKSLTLRP